MKILSNPAQINTTPSLIQSPVGKTRGVFKSFLDGFVANEKAISKALPKVPGEFKDLFDLQRSCSALQLQVECASRLADSLTGSIKKIQQLGGQG